MSLMRQRPSIWTALALCVPLLAAPALAGDSEWDARKMRQADCSRVIDPMLRAWCEGDCAATAIRVLDGRRNGDHARTCVDDKGECHMINNPMLRALCEGNCYLLDRNTNIYSLCAGDCDKFDRHSDFFHLCWKRYRHRARK